MIMHYGIIIKKTVLTMLLVVLLIAILISVEYYYVTYINANVSKLQIAFMRAYIVYSFFISNIIIFFPIKSSYLRPWRHIIGLALMRYFMNILIDRLYYLFRWDLSMDSHF